MENLFAVFALLPLALFSFVHRTKVAHAGFGFLAALAPVIASGISSIVGHKKQKAAEKKQIEYERKQAEQQAVADRAAFEAQQNSPGALAQRQKFTLQLGKLLGKAGGKEKIPPSIYNYLNQQRQAQQYVGGPGYVPKPTSGAGIWDIIGGAGQALSYLDTTKLGRKAPMSPGQPVGNIIPQQGPGAFRTGQLKDLYQTIPMKRTPWGG